MTIATSPEIGDDELGAPSRAVGRHPDTVRLARLAVAMTGGFGVACADIEGLTRTLAAELGPHGIRAVCLRPHRIEDAMPPEADLPMTKAEFRAFLEGMTLTGRLPTLASVA